MNFVVVDFEWNQALRSDSPVFNHLPIHLRGEIIEIGAVRLNPDLTLGEEFTIDVKPVFFRQIHYQVKKITGFDKERLSHGVSSADGRRTGPYRSDPSERKRFSNGYRTRSERKKRSGATPTSSLPEPISCCGTHGTER